MQGVPLEKLATLPRELGIETRSRNRSCQPTGIRAGSGWMSQPAMPTCQLRVASQSGDSLAAYVRRQRFEIGPPLTFDESYSGISALEMFAGAFAADVMNGLRLRARKRRVKIRQLEGMVKVWLVNPLTFLEVVGEEGDASIETLRLQIYISTLENEAVVRKLLEETLARSPLYLTVAKCAKVQVDFEIAM
jgi:hypothetical protein